MFEVFNTTVIYNIPNTIVILSDQILLEVLHYAMNMDFCKKSSGNPSWFVKMNSPRKSRQWLSIRQGLQLTVKEQPFHL